MRFGLKPREGHLSHTIIKSSAKCEGSISYISCILLLFDHLWFLGCTSTKPSFPASSSGFSGESGADACWGLDVMSQWWTAKNCQMEGFSSMFQLDLDTPTSWLGQPRWLEASHQKRIRPIFVHSSTWTTVFVGYLPVIKHGSGKVSRPLYIKKINFQW